MSSLQNKIVTSVAKFAGVSSSFDKKMESGIDRISAQCPKSNKSIKITKTEYKERTVYTLNPQKIQNKNHVLYFHGGAYLTNFSLLHWRFLLDLVKKTACTLIAPDYPLAPEFYYKDVFNMVLPLYRRCIEKYGSENLILMGDSAGGGLSLALAQLAKKEGLAVPQQIILLSPWLDLTCSDPAINNLEKKDPMLCKAVLIKAAQVYARKDDQTNHLLSPINGKLKNIGKISLFTGTYDILNADARQLQKKAEQESVEINYTEVSNMIHIWPIIGLTPEADTARKQIFSLIKK